MKKNVTRQRSGCQWPSVSFAVMGCMTQYCLFTLWVECSWAQQRAWCNELFLGLFKDQYGFIAWSSFAQQKEQQGTRMQHTHAQSTPIVCKALFGGCREGQTVTERRTGRTTTTNSNSPGAVSEVETFLQPLVCSELRVSSCTNITGYDIRLQDGDLMGGWW